MEFTKLEEAAIKSVLAPKADDSIADLNDAQLLLVGGGVGEVGLN